MENELEELKEISVAKIKVAYNRSIDTEATQSVLWDRSEKISRIRVIFIIALTVIAMIILTISLTLGNLSELSVLLSIFIILIGVLTIWGGIQGLLGNHGRIVNQALQLREISMNFLQYKLDNLDKQGYIDELKILEIKDTDLKERSEKRTRMLFSKTKGHIQEKIEFLERQGIKKYFITQEEIDSATEKLQKYTALRTCEAWIKFT
ncbi:MAG: hypothetical protein ACW986_17545 [Promethearchaeota archaeon]